MMILPSCIFRADLLAVLCLMFFDDSQVGEFRTPLSDGWGLTTDGKSLVATDSSDKVYWIDTSSFEITRQIAVKDGEYPVKWLNEVNSEL